MEDLKSLFLDLINKKLILSSKEKLFIEKTLSFFLDSWNKRVIDDMCHSPHHFYNVLSLSFKIIENEDLNLSRKELLSLITAVLFHDIGLFFIKKPKDVEKSIFLFKKFFNALNREERGLIDFDLVIKAIDEHSFSRNKNNSSLISKILYDADKLDVIGFIFFYRTSVYSNYKKFLLNYNIGFNYLKYLKMINKGNLTREDCLKIFNDEIYVIDHYFIKAFWLKEKLNFNYSKKEFDKRNKRVIKFIKDAINEIF